MKTILITGSKGQLGSEFRFLKTLYPQFKYLFTDVAELDITDKEACLLFFKEHQIHYLINCAAYTAVDKAEEDQHKAYLLNATAVANLVAACKQVNATFIQISTDYVFDGTNHLPYSEDQAVCPQSYYGVTKHEGEQVALEYAKSMVIRTAWLYSIYGNNFVKTMMRLGAEREQLSVVFDQIGSPTLAFDLAQAILEIIVKIEANVVEFQSGVFHYSNEGVCSWYDFAHQIMQLAKLDCKVYPIESKDYPTPAKRPAYSVLNKSKIKQVYGLAIPHWSESLAKTIQQL